MATCRMAPSRMATCRVATVAWRQAAWRRSHGDVFPGKAPLSEAPWVQGGPSGKAPCLRRFSLAVSGG